MKLLLGKLEGGRDCDLGSGMETTTGDRSIELINFPKCHLSNGAILALNNLLGGKSDRA